MEIKTIIWAFVWFAVMGGALGLLLAFAGKKFAVKQDERIPKIQELLPGANCGGCGFAGCAALAEAIVNGKARPGACTAADEKSNAKIADIMGKKAEKRTIMRAQVMCFGTKECTKEKYNYVGVHDCAVASRVGAGYKSCPHACLGFGSCVEMCKFDAISIVGGIARVDKSKCTGCGTCVHTCPKEIIKLIPLDAKHWVSCSSKEKGAVTRKNCSTGCIGCHLCEKNCESNAITVVDNLATVDYEKCTNCGKCVDVCPNHIIVTADTYLRHIPNSSIE